MKKAKKWGFEIVMLNQGQSYAFVQGCSRLLYIQGFCSLRIKKQLFRVGHSRLTAAPSKSF